MIKLYQWYYYHVLAVLKALNYDQTELLMIGFLLLLLTNNLLDL
jgi:hypothetical protein